MSIADLMVFMRSWERPPRSGEDGRCRGGELERSVGEDVRRDMVRRDVLPTALPCETADTREVAEAE